MFECGGVQAEHRIHTFLVLIARSKDINEPLDRFVSQETGNHLLLRIYKS